MRGEAVRSGEGEIAIFSRDCTRKCCSASGHRMERNFQSYICNQDYLKKINMCAGFTSQALLCPVC